jgi:hypothetical protein
VKNIRCLYTRHFGISLDIDDNDKYYHVKVYGSWNRETDELMSVTTDKFEYANEIFKQLEDDLRNSYAV